MKIREGLNVLGIEKKESLMKEIMVEMESVKRGIKV